VSERQNKVDHKDDVFHDAGPFGAYKNARYLKADRRCRNP